jgi:hypothetical protein
MQNDENIQTAREHFLGSVVQKGNPTKNGFEAG